MLIIHGKSDHGILSEDELALLFRALDVARRQCIVPDDTLNIETVAKEIVAAYDRGVKNEQDLAEVAITTFRLVNRKLLD